MTPKLRSRLLIMAGTVVFALLPLFVTSWQSAILDGAFLVISFAFSSDALFRCLDPTNAKGGNTKLFLAICSAGMLALAALQYGPIANDLRKENLILTQSIRAQNILPITVFEREREEDQSAVPNSSVALLISSVVAEFSAIILLEG